MPESHNKRAVRQQSKKPTKRTDRPARRANDRNAGNKAPKEQTPSTRFAQDPNARQKRANNTPRQRTHATQTNLPRRNTSPNFIRDTLANKNTSVIIWIIFALVAVIAIAFAIGSCSSGSSTGEDGGALPASDKAAPEAQTITLSFAGDCTLGTDENFDRATSFNARYEAVDDPSYFFANVADIFAQDDATIVNMEGTLTDSTTRADKTFAFKAPAEYAQILVEGNVEAASLANNHSKDYGETSYTDTIEALDAVGIPTFGYDRISYLDVKGVKVALIGTYELAAGIGIKDEMVNNINLAKEEGAQVIVVFTHWGTERETVPDSVQMELGHAAIDAGATIVVGSHPHVIQGIEEYHGHQIVYSLGNFCFGGNKNPSDKDCMIFQATFTVQGESATTDSTTVIPCSISSTSSSNNYQPTPASGAEKERIEAKIKTSSDAIARMAASLSE